MAMASVPVHTNKAISMSVKRTFIELVAEPVTVLRARSCTDSELLVLDEDVRMLDISDASTETPSEEDSTQNPADWESPYWGPAGDLYYANADEVDSFALPSSSNTDNVDSFALASSSLPWGYQDWYPAQFVQPTFPEEWFCSAAFGAETMWNVDQGIAPLPVENWQTMESSTSRSEPSVPKTTIMLRNIPSQYSRSDVVQLLEDEGFEGSFDLVYVPMDFNNECCLGYAFVNLLRENDADRAWNVFTGFNDWACESDNTCEVVWSDPHQGSEALIERYRNSPVMHPSMPDAWKPAYFLNGVMVPFPAPTQAIKAPKQKQTRRKAKKDNMD